MRQNLRASKKAYTVLTLTFLLFTLFSVQSNSAPDITPEKMQKELYEIMQNTSLSVEKRQEKARQLMEQYKKYEIQQAETRKNQLESSPAAMVKKQAYPSQILSPKQAKDDYFEAYMDRKKVRLQDYINVQFKLNNDKGLSRQEINKKLTAVKRKYMRKSSPKMDSVASVISDTKVMTAQEYIEKMEDIMNDQRLTNEQTRERLEALSMEYLNPNNPLLNNGFKPGGEMVTITGELNDFVNWEEPRLYVTAAKYNYKGCMKTDNSIHHSVSKKTLKKHIDITGSRFTIRLPLEPYTTPALRKCEFFFSQLSFLLNLEDIQKKFYPSENINKGYIYIGTGDLHDIYGKVTSHCELSKRHEKTIECSPIHVGKDVKGPVEISFTFGNQNQKQNAGNSLYIVDNNSFNVSGHYNEATSLKFFVQYTAKNKAEKCTQLYWKKKRANQFRDKKKLNQFRGPLEATTDVTSLASFNGNSYSINFPYTAKETQCDLVTNNFIIQTIPKIKSKITKLAIDGGKTSIYIKDIINRKNTQGLKPLNKETSQICTSYLVKSGHEVKVFCENEFYKSANTLNKKAIINFKYKSKIKRK